MSESIESELHITSEHTCHWSEAVESTGDELLEARKQVDSLESQLRAADELAEAVKLVQKDFIVEEIDDITTFPLYDAITAYEKVRKSE